MLLQGDMHTHTIASTHAYSTILENCQYAKIAGLKGIAMTDHAMNMPDSPHVWHFENLHILPREINGITVLKGAETNIIDASGRLDIDDGLVKRLEWVVASMHGDTFASRDPQIITRAYLNAVRNKNIDVIGHPSTTNFVCEYEKIIKAFKEYEKFVEINESSLLAGRSKRENLVEIMMLCKKYEVPVVIDTDCHFCQLIGKTPLAFSLCEELDFPQKLIVNLDWNKIREYVLKKRPYLDI